MPSLSPCDPKTLAEKIRRGERRALAEAITLIESTRLDHRKCAEQLLSMLAPYTGQALRLGISGAPGVGKSSLIEALGSYLIERGQRVAVLAIDPSSTSGGGSILGDKTRMEKLSNAPQAFIRPSPNAGTLGGVAARTRESIALCEAAGFEIIIVETVGVGQSEVAAANMTDCFLLMQSTNSGDELQALKKGILELADIVVYNKIDINMTANQAAIAQMQSTLKFLASVIPQRLGSRQTPVLGVSALQNHGIAELWHAITDYQHQLKQHNRLSEKRAKQNIEWTWELINQGLLQRFQHHPQIIKALPDLLAQVAAGNLQPQQAAEQLLQRWN